MAKRNKAKRESTKRMAVSDAMDLVSDDMPDGAYWAMVSEMSGVEYGDLGSELMDEDDEDIF